MPRSIRFILAFALCAAVLPAVADDASPSSSLRVISYNVQFLPGMASAMNERKEPHYRAQRIAEEMAGFDIVGLQEVFHDRFRAIIIDGLRETWGHANVVVSPKPEKRFNGGCLIATRLPIIESDAMIFEHYSTPEEYGVRADGYAAKGVIYARIARSEDSLRDAVDVFVTHLEARADHLRPLQYKEMAAFVAKKAHPDDPVLLLGDFNTNGVPDERAQDGSQYNLLMQALRDALPEMRLADVWPELEGDAYGGTSKQDSTERGKRIDYILLANPTSGPRSLAPQEIWINPYLDEKVVALSDHSAVGANLSWMFVLPDAAP